MESTWMIFSEEVFTSNGFSGAITSTQITMRFSIVFIKVQLGDNITLF